MNYKDGVVKHLFYVLLKKYHHFLQKPEVFEDENLNLIDDEKVNYK